MPGKRPTTVDEYIAGFPGEVRAAMEELRATIRQAAPGAAEKVSYGMAAYVRGRTRVYFAAWKEHIGLYGLSPGDDDLARALAPYAGEKGSLRFPLAEPLPLDLIEKLVRASFSGAPSEPTRGRGRTE